jgi:hypothetical protein
MLHAEPKARKTGRKGQKDEREVQIGLLEVNKLAKCSFCEMGTAWALQVISD